jgi:hypothetical protein
MGRFTLGFLDAVTGETEIPDAGSETGTRILGRQNLMVGRMKANFLSESYIGGLMTHGEASGQSDNWLAGVDARLGTRNFLDSGKNFAVFLWGLKSETPELEGKDGAYGFDFSFPNDLISARGGWQEIGENFNPALGFVRRTGVRNTRGNFMFRPRPEMWGIRQLEFGVNVNRFYSLTERRTESSGLNFNVIEVEFNDGSSVEYALRRNFERLFRPFEIHDEVTIPTGDYTFHTHDIAYQSSPTRPVQWEVSYETGPFYSGTSKELNTEVSWRNRNITTSFELQQYWVDLMEGEFTTRLGLFRFDYSFSPLITLTNFVQYDTDSRNMGLQSRLRWIVRPGNEVFFVMNHSWQKNPLDRFDALTNDVRAKINYTFRF